MKQHTMPATPRRVLFERLLPQSLGRYRIVAEIGLIILFSLTALRVGLLLYFSDTADLSIGSMAAILATGLRYDILITLILSLPQILYLALMPSEKSPGRISLILLEIQWLIGYHFLFCSLIAEWLFFAEYQNRPNYIAFEYLVYPKEVCCNIWESYQTGKLLIVVSLISIFAYAFLRSRHLYFLRDGMSLSRRRSAPAITGLIIAIMWLTTPFSAMNLTANRTANECSMNGLYSLVYFAWTCKFDYNDFYKTIDETQTVERTRRLLESSDSPFLSASNQPLDRIVHTGKQQRDLNVVIILEESLGSDFIGTLGDDRGLSPCFDALCQKGKLYDNWFATGNRTARALEAVSTAMPPLPTESILKRDHSSNMWTLAKILSVRGYERLFITGGRGLFDGVKSFMTANGYNHFVEQNDYVNPSFVNAWGVADEDLFRRSIEEMDKLSHSGRPFLATLLTVSNHRPFTFPAGRIDPQYMSREAAVKYADWALGQFFEEVSKKDYYKNTLFVALGDHGARVYGCQLFPIRSYRVPVLMIDPSESRASTCSTLASTLDIAPTVMGVLGGEYRSVFFGRDVNSLKPEQGYALMQHNHDIALLDANNRMTVLSSARRSFSFELNREDWSLKTAPDDSARDVADVISIFQLANRLYYSDSYVPDSNIPTQIATADSLAAPR